jgi:hypothetical protein
MAVYRPKRKGGASKFYVCEFVYQGKRFQESTGATSKTLAKEYEKGRRAELERAAAGLPTEQCVCQLDLAPFDALIWPHLVIVPPARADASC